MLFEKVALDMEIRKYINIAGVVAIIFYLATLYCYPENLELRMVMQRMVFAAIFLKPTNPDETLFKGKLFCGPLSHFLWLRQSLSLITIR